MPFDSIKRSKFLSLVLRHQPEKVGIILDSAGWVSVDELLEGCRRHGFALTREELEEVVRGCEKQRFAFDENGTRIRASQGHSVKVDLAYEPIMPPPLLFHGTVERFLPSIRQQVC